MIMGRQLTAKDGNAALVEILRELVRTKPEKLPALAEAVRTRSRNHIARSPAEIYPSRPDLARAEEIGGGWLVGLNIANREKLRIIKSACDVYGVSYGTDIAADLPNAG
jgi:predicted type IV restriction endonuclease